jgi:hypothetical protein
MEPKANDDGYPELDFDWADAYRLRDNAQRAGKPAEVRRMRAEAERMFEALKARHAVELDYWRRHGVEHPRKIERMREDGWGVTWGPPGA